MKKANRDIVTGIVGIIAVIIFAIFTANLRKVPNLIEPGPTLMPYVALALILLSSIMLLIQGLKNRQKNVEQKPYFPNGGGKKVFFGFLELVVYAIALTLVGFLISTPFAMFSFVNTLKGSGKVTWWQNLLISVAVTAVLYLVFVVGFQIKLPQGILFK